jgi:hypothetical protein
MVGGQFNADPSILQLTIHLRQLFLAAIDHQRGVAEPRVSDRSILRDLDQSDVVMAGAEGEERHFEPVVWVGVTIDELHPQFVDVELRRCLGIVHGKDDVTYPANLRHTDSSHGRRS